MASLIRGVNLARLIKRKYIANETYDFERKEARKYEKTTVEKMRNDLSVNFQNYFELFY
jgi:hypothetical protein